MRAKEYHEALLKFDEDVIKPCYVKLGIDVPRGDNLGNSEETAAR